MTIEIAKEIFECIKGARLTGLRNDLIQSAVRYARLRVDWHMASGEERIRIDEERTRAHDALISNCNILSRAMIKEGEDHSWRAKLGSDRKIIGDFACHLHAIIGIAAR